MKMTTTCRRCLSDMTSHSVLDDKVGALERSVIMLSRQLDEAEAKLASIKALVSGWEEPVDAEYDLLAVARGRGNVDTD